MQLELTRWGDTCRIINVTFMPVGGGRTIEISVNHSANLDNGKLDPPEVNWPAIGSVSSAVTEQFADALIEAARVARELAKMNPNYQPALGPWRERNRKRQKKLYRAKVKIENGKVEMLYE
jgi:hypothetical protein